MLKICGTAVLLPLLAHSVCADDTERGASLYDDSCRACHTSTMGRIFSGSPKITHLQSDYILLQLQSFASGARVPSDDDKQKAKMVAAAKALSEQDQLDIVRYIAENFTKESF